jgi:hypothetical protein
MHGPMKVTSEHHTSRRAWRRRSTSDAVKSSSNSSASLISKSSASSISSASRSRSAATWPMSSRYTGHSTTPWSSPSRFHWSAGANNSSSLLQRALPASCEVAIHYGRGRGGGSRHPTLHTCQRQCFFYNAPYLLIASTTRFPPHRLTNSTSAGTRHTCWRSSTTWGSKLAPHVSMMARSAEHSPVRASITRCCSTICKGNPCVKEIMCGQYRTTVPQ